MHLNIVINSYLLITFKYLYQNVLLTCLISLTELVKLQCIIGFSFSTTCDVASEFICPREGSTLTRDKYIALLLEQALHQECTCDGYNGHIDS